MRRPHLHVHLPDFDVGGTEQWLHILIRNLSVLPWRLSATQGVSTDATADDLLRGWDRLDLDQIPPDALVIAPCDMDLVVRHSRRVIAVAHGINGYYKSILAGGGYLKGVAIAAVVRDAFPPGAPVTTLHNGIDVGRLEPARGRTAVRAALGIAPSAVVIGFVGRWSLGKNPLAAAKAAAMIPGGVALYVGPYDKNPALAAQAAAMADCRFVPPEQASDIGDFYAAMDVCMIANHTEGFSLAMAEAWCAGVPVVATPVGIALEHPDLVVSVPFDPDASTLAEAVEIARSPGQAPAVARARQTVLDRYTAEHMGQRWRDYLTGVLRELEGAEPPAAPTAPPAHP